MKICFFLQRRWALIGHAMATHLQENFSDTEFCGLVSMRPSLKFLQDQKDIHYTSLLLEDDIHKKLFSETIDYPYLTWLEKEYGTPNLWPHLYVDRVVMNSQLRREYPYNEPLLSHEDMLRRIQVTAKEIIAFLDREKPDVVVISVIGSVGSSLLYTIAQKRGIKTITIELARIQNRMAFSETYKGFSWVTTYFKEIQGGRKSQEYQHAIDFLNEFRERPTAYRKEADPSFNKQTLRRANLFFLRPAHLLWSIYWHLKTLLKDLGKAQNSDYTDIFIWWHVWDKLKRKTRGLVGYADLYTKLGDNERYAYYPLHYDPEMATLLYAPYYTDQMMLIKAIARSLPVDMKLYVKEHPAMVGYRTRKFYKEILKTPNVQLIGPNQSGILLAKNASLTVTITGSGGWESILFKKPVITFGDVFYNDLSFVKQCRGFEELPYLIKSQLEHQTNNEEETLNFISALLEDSIPVDYMNLWINADSLHDITKDSGIAAFTNQLGEKIGLHKK